MNSWCCALPGGVRLAVQIAANAKTTEVMGVHAAVLKLRVQAQPVDGKANAALIGYLAGRLGVPKSAVVITHGHSHQRKLLEVLAPGLTPQAVSRLLGMQAP